MTIQELVQNRKGIGTTGAVAYKLVVGGWKYSEVTRKYGVEVRQRFLVEALIANGGNQRKTSEALAINWKTVYRAVCALGLSLADIRKLAKQEGQ